MAKKDDPFMRVDCPDCGKVATFNELTWMRSIRAVREGTFEVATRNGAIEIEPVLACTECKKTIHARKWHRNAEQAAFAAAGLAKAS
jgi:ssDNA-binding Zn-finger/Zn-ribbon topoisomerase 1